METDDRQTDFAKTREHLNILLKNIRVKPQSMRDSLICQNIDDKYVSLTHSQTEGTFWSSCSSYGNSSKNIPKHGSSIVVKETGQNFGQDYVNATRNYICLADGHGVSGERFACFTGIYLPHYIDKGYIDKNLSISNSDSFNLIFNHISNIFIKIKQELERYYYMTDTICFEDQPIERVLFKNKIGSNGGTTLNYASIHCVCDEEGLKRRFIVSANVGDSETYSVWRYPCGKVRVKVHSGLHGVENIEEAQRIINRHKNKILTVLPIYNRFHSYDKRGTQQSEFPKETLHHIDNIPNRQTYPIYKIDKHHKISVNLETLHKVNMGLGKYGEMFGIDQWYGGIQSLRTNVIEKKIDGKWKGVAPIPDGNPINFGSTPAGLCQTTRSFGDLHNKHIHSTPHINIVEIPDDIHVTLICQSDGYADTVYLSEVADVINEMPRNVKNQAESIKKKLVKLMYNNIIGQRVRGYDLDDKLNATWDDVSFGIIDSPSLHFQQ